jgi:hypothetical protein
MRPKNVWNRLRIVIIGQLLVMYRDAESSGTATKELGLLVTHVASESY